MGTTTSSTIPRVVLKPLKILLKIVGGIVAFLALVLLVLRITGFEPPTPMVDNPTRWQNHPGLWLKGDLVTTPVSDWSFTDQYQRVKVQVHTWYLLPHSVTTTATAVGNKLYLTSGARKGDMWPGNTGWHRGVARDPHFLLKIGDKLYKVKMVYVVTDPAELETVIQAKKKKYPPYGHTINRYRPPGPRDTEMAIRVVSDTD